MDQDDTLNYDGDIPQPKRGPGRPKGSKNKARQEPKVINVAQALAQVPKGPREIAPSLGAPFEVYHTPDPLAMVQALYAEVAWRIQTLRNQRQIEKLAAKDKANDRIERGLQANEAIVPILIDTANTLMKTLQSHEKALLLAEKLSKNKSPAELLELAIIKVMGQDLATQQAIIKRLRAHVASIAPENAVDKVRMGESALSNMTAAEAFAALGVD